MLALIEKYRSHLNAFGVFCLEWKKTQLAVLKENDGGNRHFSPKKGSIPILALSNSVISP